MNTISRWDPAPILQNNKSHLWTQMIWRKVKPSSHMNLLNPVRKCSVERSVHVNPRNTTNKKNTQKPEKEKSIRDAIRNK